LQNRDGPETALRIGDQRRPQRDLDHGRRPLLRDPSLSAAL